MPRLKAFYGFLWFVEIERFCYQSLKLYVIYVHELKAFYGFWFLFMGILEDFLLQKFEHLYYFCVGLE